MLYLIIILLVTLSVYLLIAHINKRKSHPPGPIGLPIIGIAFIKFFQFIKLIKVIPNRHVFYDLHKKYGDIWSIEFWNQRIIVLSSYETIYEAFFKNSSLFAGKPTHVIYKIYSNNNKGILLSDGKEWLDHRHLALKAFRDLGLYKPEFQDKIIAASEEMCQRLDSKLNENIDPLNEFIKPIATVILKLIFNVSYNDSLHSKELLSYQKHLKDMEWSDYTDLKMFLFPTLFTTKFAKYLFPSISSYYNGLEGSMNYIIKQCTIREEIISTDNKLECVFDYFYQASNQGNFQRFIDDKNSLQSIFDLFNGGMDTTNNMIVFSCLFLGKYNQLQEELYQELQSIDPKVLTMESRQYCPKFLSFIEEIHRYCQLVSKFQHRVVEKCSFLGYTLYPDDIVMADVYSVSRNDKLFDKPFEFKPKRFLNASQTEFQPNKTMMPFGLGKRNCIGEKLANLELIIFLSRIILRYRVLLPELTKEDFDEIVEGRELLVHTPKPHNIVLTLRSP